VVLHPSCTALRSSSFSWLCRLLGHEDLAGSWVPGIKTAQPLVLEPFLRSAHNGRALKPIPTAKRLSIPFQLQRQLPNNILGGWFQELKMLFCEEKHKNNFSFPATVD
jgi:hypothetical protein